MEEHAKFSPSSMYRLMACPASFQKNADIKPIQSIHAKRGTQLHELFEKIWNHHLNGRNHKVYAEARKYQNKLEAAKDLAFKVEDIQYVLDSADYVLQLYDRLYRKDPKTTISLEEKVSLLPWGVDDVWGTADVVIRSKALSTIVVIDHKFGSGVPVYAENNEQGLCYLVGAIDPRELPKYIYFSVSQPPLDNYSIRKFEEMDILKFVDSLKDMTYAIESGNPEFNPGDKQCRFCPSRNICKARYTMAINEAKEVFSIADRLPDVTQEEKAHLAVLLLDLEQIKKSLFADLQTDLLNGRPVPGFKLVSGRSIRKWKDEGDAMAWMLRNGAIKEEDIFEKKFISPPKAEKLNRKLKKSEEFSKLVEKPAGKPILVPASDKRPDYDINLTADAVFTKT